MTITPYYQDKQITLYCGDCNDILPQLWDPAIFDLLLTDPPYGIGRDGQHGPEIGRAGIRKGYEFGEWDEKPPSAEIFKLIISHSCAQIIWGGNYFSDRLSVARGWLVWDKMQYGLTQADGELAWNSLDQPLRIFRQGRGVLNGDGSCHPTQKPISLMKWCIGQASWAKTILDPFAGSGSTLVAAKEMGLRATGVEKSEKYCSMAVNRLRQNALQW